MTMTTSLDLAPTSRRRPGWWPPCGTTSSTAPRRAPAPRWPRCSTTCTPGGGLRLAAEKRPDGRALRRRGRAPGGLARAHPAGARRAGRRLAAAVGVGGHHRDRGRDRCRRPGRPGHAQRGARARLGPRRGDRPALPRRRRRACRRAPTSRVEFAAAAPEMRNAIYAPVVPVPDDAPPLDRLIGSAGRDPGWSAPDPTPPGSPVPGSAWLSSCSCSPSEPGARTITSADPTADGGRRGGRADQAAGDAATPGRPAERDRGGHPQAAAEPEQDVVQPQAGSAGSRPRPAASCRSANATAFARSSRWMTASTPLSPSRPGRHALPAGWCGSAAGTARAAGGAGPPRRAAARRRPSPSRASRSAAAAPPRCPAPRARRTRRPASCSNGRPAARSCAASASGPTSSSTLLVAVQAVGVEPAVQPLGGEDVGLAEGAVGHRPEVEPLVAEGRHLAPTGPRARSGER